MRSENGKGKRTEENLKTTSLYEARTLGGRTADEWTNGRMDEWTNGRMDERMLGMAGSMGLGGLEVILLPTLSSAIMSLVS